ncbi:uncharacterized protein LOC131156378 isoform X2 [Malania oleifera]|uniref:uncharacterized protein LOC131156378 isoform X2 n=1 Tax=Malania oleifera TaxID=397392 RepID=UPI0025AEBB1A|nr:uncharacterized protein LOC131156378 isoform X2 [Malania oleifera]
MALRVGRLRPMSKCFRLMFPGTHYQQARQDIHFSTFLMPFPTAKEKVRKCILERGCSAVRFSTVSEISQKTSPAVELLSFIESASEKLEGPYHFWLNKVYEGHMFCKKDGFFLVLAGVFQEESLIMLEKVKLLQQRYPLLHVIGFQSGSSISSTANKTRLIQLISKEYITFPILLSNKNFSEMTSAASFILFEDFRSPLLCHECTVDVGILNSAIEELNAQHSGSSGLISTLETTGLKQNEIIKEPYICSIRNLLLYYPACISIDENSGRLFLSDSNHHRIIVFDGSGMILDCIGSSPGFEDGSFESAKFVRPAASFYHDTEDCLYVVDSENHAIRRADMGKRVLETVHPSHKSNKKYGSLWSWIMNKLGLERAVKDEDIGSESLIFPWHLMKSEDDILLVMNKSFKTLWTLDMVSGEIKEVITGFPKIWEICGWMIMEKVSILKQLPHEWLQHEVDQNSPLKEIPYAGLMSSLATFQNHVIICDTVGHRVLSYSRESGISTNFQFSNFGILGLPYWFSFSLDNVHTVDYQLLGTHADHLQCLSLLPGRLDIKLTVDIPKDTELVEPIDESCIWRQARGAAADVSGGDSVVASSDKVGIAQQWYDELDNVAHAAPGSELSEDTTSDRIQKSQEDRVYIDCAVNASPGTSEVVIYAALYLRLRKGPDSQEGNVERSAARIADLLNPQKGGSIERDACVEYLLGSNRDLCDVVFMKPLHVRVKLDCLDHPKSDSSKDIILTDSSIDINVSLNS